MANTLVHAYPILRMKPVVFVHGYLDTWYMPWWGRMQNLMKKIGLLPEEIYFVDKGSLPGTTVDSPEKYAEIVRGEVEKAYDRHDTRVNLIGHSMGGIDSRVYVEEREGKELVDTLVTLGSPHQGTLASWLGVFTPGGRDMRMSSDVIKRRATSVVDDVEYVAVWSSADELVVPTKNGKMRREEKENVRNVGVGPFSHFELNSPTVLSICQKRTGVFDCHYTDLKPDKSIKSKILNKFRIGAV